MNAKRIVCLFLAAVLLLGLMAGAISMLVSAQEATTTAPTTTETATNTTGVADTADDGMTTVDGDKIVFLLLGVVVPVVMFTIILVKVNRR